jgi:hypothetical protein
MSRQARPIFFFSNSERDKFSRLYIEEIKTCPEVAKALQYVCIDGKRRADLPSCVTKVPTLYVPGEDDPVLLGDRIITWVREQNIRMGGAGGSAEPSAFFGTEMTGFSSPYADLQSDTSSLMSDAGNTLKQGFAFVSGAIAAGAPVQTAGAGVSHVGGSGRPVSKKEEALTRAYENALKNREMDVPGPVQRQGGGGGMMR